MQAATGSARHPGVAPSEYARRFVRNLAYGLAVRVAQMGASIVVLAVVVRHLGPERYSLVVLATTISTFLNLVQLSASAGMAAQLNDAFARQALREFAQRFTAASVLSLGAAAVMGAGLAAVLTVFWGALRIPDAFRDEARLVVAAIAGTSICSCLAMPAQAVLQAVHRIDVTERTYAAGLVIRVGGVLAAFGTSHGTPVVYGAILLAESLAVMAANWVQMRSTVPEARASYAVLSRAALASVVRFNLLAMFNSLSYVLFMQTPVLILQRQAGLVAAGAYGIGLQLSNLARMCLMPALNALSPVAISLVARGDRKNASAVFWIATKGFAAAAAVLWVMLALVGDDLVRVWLHRDVPSLARALPAIAAATSVGVATMPASVFVVALRRLRVPAVAGVGLAVMMTGCAVLWAHGEASAATVRAGWLLAAFFGAYNLVRLHIASRSLGGSRRLAAVAFTRAALPGISAVPVLALARSAWPGMSPALLAAVVCTAFGCAGLTARYTLFTPGEWETVWVLRRTRTQAAATDEAQPADGGYGR